MMRLGCVKGSIGEGKLREKVLLSGSCMEEGWESWKSIGEVYEMDGN